MTTKRPRDTRLRCDDCGHSTPLTTAGMAERALRQHSCETVKERTARAQRRLDGLASAGPERPCLHKQANHVHGTRACYVLDKCRCRPCRDATSKAERDRLRDQLYGRWNGYVDAQPAREHVQSLMDQGMGLKRIVAVSGISQGAIWKLMYGKRQPDGTLRPSKRVTPSVEARILATRLDLAGGAVVRNVGTARRIQALVARGWSISKIGARLGITPTNMTPVANGTRDVTTGTAKAVADLYDELWNTLPPRDGHRDKIAYSRALSHARRLGWAPPLAWDDDTIDDPAAQPFTQSEQRRGGKRVHVEDIEFLLDDMPLATTQWLADRLHVTKDAIQQACRRGDRLDLLDQLSRNARLAKEGTAA
jgi:transcriptional regulator with XRE-family HTH domain